MSSSIELKGHCLCGSVRVSVKSAKKSVGACHCGMCRRWTGGPFLAVDCGTEVTLEGEDHVSVFDSSAWAQRGFCSRCGSHLFYRIKQNQQYHMPAGLFEHEDRDQFVLDHQVFIDEKPAYYSFANETKDMTGAEIFAMYAPKSE